MKTILALFTICILALPLAGQRTVGMITHDPSRAFPGYNLVYPHNQPNVYLLDNCGRIVHTWQDSAMWRPGNAAYLLENGYLVKTKRLTNFQNDSIWAGGGGAIIEIRDWQNALIWRFELNNPQQRLHHDFKRMPNGNILMIAWELKTEAEAIQAGRKPALLPQKKLWPDYLLEVNPSTNQVVWEWHAWDHLIQDFDPSKANFGDVKAHPELIDVNWDTSNGHPDWMHANAIDYNPELDQIILSVPTFDEVWIIDHSTTTQEAAGHTGGKSGKGGDLLYRWGNPAAYRAGTTTDQKLFYPHDIHWVGPFLDNTHPHYGKLATFNNQVNPRYSTVNVFDPGFDRSTWSYPMKDGKWLPEKFDLDLTHPDTFQINSDGLSSVQLLSNGNTLILSGRWGYAFELTPSNQICWEYKVPLSGGTRVAQGRVLGIGANITFRMDRYPLNFPAFSGKDISPKGYLELNPDTASCTSVTPVREVLAPSGLRFFPNPAGEVLTLFLDEGSNQVIQVYDLTGRLHLQSKLIKGHNTLDISALADGLYFIRVPGRQAEKLVIQKSLR